MAWLQPFSSRSHFGFVRYAEFDRFPTVSFILSQLHLNLSFLSYRPHTRYNSSISLRASRHLFIVSSEIPRVCAVIHGSVNHISLVNRLRESYHSPQLVVIRLCWRRFECPSVCPSFKLCKRESIYESFFSCTPLHGRRIPTD